MRKYNIIALSILAVVLLAITPVWALYGNASTYVSDTIPTSMVKGVTITPTVTMQNSGTSTWTVGPYNGGSPVHHPPVVSEYNFGPTDDSPSVAWGPRTNVGASVAPGASKTFTLTMTPNAPGTYVCKWQMVDEMEEWFGATLTKTITVTCPTPAAETYYVNEQFDSYTAGGSLAGKALSGGIAAAWNVHSDATNYPDFSASDTGRITVVAPSGGSNSGANAAQVESVGAPTTSLFMNNGSWSTSFKPWEQNNRIKYHFNFKPLTSVGAATFWQMRFDDGGNPGNRASGVVQGSDTYVTAYSGSGGGPTGPGSDAQNFTAGWHSIDMITLYNEGSGVLNDVYYFLDGKWFFTGTSTAGGPPSDGKIRAFDLIQLKNSATADMKVLFDDLRITGNAKLPKSVITAPFADDVFATLTPTITWTREWDSCDIAATQVKVCASNDPNATAVWGGFDVANPNSSQVTGTLPNNTDLYVFERDKLSNGGYQPWSAGVHFKCAVLPPNRPTMAGPSGTIASKKPVLTFTGDAHTLLQVKATTDSAGVNVAFDSGQISSTGNGYSTTPLAPGDYYGFAKIGTASGWSAWSTPGLHFKIDTAGQLVDIRHMNEPNLISGDDDNPGGDTGRPDGFGHILNSQYADNISAGTGNSSTTVSVTAPICGNVALKWDDAGPSRSIRTHKMTNYINLDNGVTFLWAVSVLSEGGSDGIGASWRMANNLLMDKAPSGETYFVALRTLPTGIGIITDSSAAGEAYGTGFGHHWADWTPSTDYRIIRLTGRNVVAGDYNSTVWKVYVNENPTPAITATGCLVGSVMDTTPNMWQCDAIALGHGSSDSTGAIQFDWTAVNGTCDYAPGEWDPSGAAGYTSIGAAKAPGVEARPVTIDGSMVVTKVVSHTDPGPDLTPGTPDDITIQDCYFVQDLTNNLLGAGVKVVSADTHGGAIAEGAQISHIAGAMSEVGGCRSISNPAVTVLGSAGVQGTAMSQKTLMGPCIDQALGSSMDTTGMSVRVFGRVPTAPLLITTDAFPGGAYVVYVDDGSGAVDGRESASGMPVPGIRVLIDASDPSAIVPNFGDYVMLEGIAGYEATTTGAYPNVRQILYPSFTVLASGV